MLQGLKKATDGGFCKPHGGPQVSLATTLQPRFRAVWTAALAAAQETVYVLFA